MAIQKEKTLKDGTQGNYWRITSEIRDRIRDKVVFVISLYKSEADRNNGLQPLKFSKTFTFSAKGETIDDITAWGYTKIKEKANTEVVDPFSSNPENATPFYFDMDLAGGQDV